VVFPIFPAASPVADRRSKPSKGRKNALAQAVDGLFEHGRPSCPRRRRSSGSCFPRAATFLLISSSAWIRRIRRSGSTSTLPKSLIGQIDRRAAELGMSRSSFFGLAASTALTYFPVHTVVRPELAEPRSKVHKTGRLRNPDHRRPKSRRCNGRAIAYDQLQPCIDTVVASHDVFSGSVPANRRDPSPLAVTGHPCQMR